MPVRSAKPPISSIALLVRESGMPLASGSPLATGAAYPASATSHQHRADRRVCKELAIGSVVDQGEVSGLAGGGRVSGVRRDDSLRVPGIDLLENLLRQVEARDLPAPLARRVPVVEVLVRGFEEAEPVPVQALAGRRVRAEQDAVLVAEEELTGAARLAPQLGLAGPGLHYHVRMAVEN